MKNVIPINNFVLHNNMCVHIIRNILQFKMQ